MMNLQSSKHVVGTSTEFAVLVCFCTYLPDDDIVQVETHSRNISDIYCFTVDLQFVRSDPVQLYLVISDKSSAGPFANYKQSAQATPWDVKINDGNQDIAECPHVLVINCAITKLLQNLH